MGDGHDGADSLSQPQSPKGPAKTLCSRKTARQGSITEHGLTGRGAGLARALGPESGTMTCLTGYPEMAVSVAEEGHRGEVLQKMALLF